VAWSIAFPSARYSVKPFEGTVRGCTILGNYTLLADENCNFSKAENLLAAFKAHIVFNVLTNGSLTFSDNQIIASPNLRKLIRRDGVIRKLVESGQIDVAVRDPGQGINDLREVFEAFRAEGKIPEGYGNLDDSPEITFMEEHSRKIGWDYGSVRGNFTTDCERIVLEQSRIVLSDTNFDFLRDAVREEAEQNNGLGRVFLQDHLPGMLEHRGIMTRGEAFRFLTRCTDAVYLSNLPKTIGLNPIYANEHKESFKLLRGGQYELKDYGDDLDLKPRLPAKHFTQGLNMLDMEDIALVHSSDAYRDFARLSASANPVRDFDQLFVVYGELNRVIEDRIITRFRGLLNHSPAPDPRKLKRQYGSWIEMGVARLMDVLSIANVASPVAGVVLGWGVNFLVDTVRKKVDPERRHIEAARHDLERRRLETYLRKHGKADELSFEAEMHDADSFDREIIVQ